MAKKCCRDEGKKNFKKVEVKADVQTIHHRTIRRPRSFSRYFFGRRADRVNFAFVKY